MTCREWHRKRMAHVAQMMEGFEMRQAERTLKRQSDRTKDRKPHPRYRRAH